MFVDLFEEIRKYISYRYKVKIGTVKEDETMQ